VGKSSKLADAAAAPGKGVPAKPGATGNSAAQNRSRLQANGAEKGTSLPKAGSVARGSAAAPSLAARAASIAAARQAKTNTPQPNGTSKLASAAAPKVASLASRAAALAPSRQIRVGAGNASNLPVATLSARAETLGISGINKGMGNISANLMAQAAERYRIQASLPELTEAKKAEGNSAAMQAVSALDAITVSVCETGCTKEQSNSVLAVQIQMQTSGNPLAAPADTRRDSFHHMPWKNNSGLMNSGRSRTVADFTENLEDVNLMGTLNLFIIP
jgi:hypothetical protein